MKNLTLYITIKTFVVSKISLTSLKVVFRTAELHLFE